MHTVCYQSYVCVQSLCKTNGFELINLGKFDFSGGNVTVVLKSESKKSAQRLISDYLIFS